MRVYDEDIHYANERYNTQDYLQKIFINIVKMEENYFSRASQIWAASKIASIIYEEKVWNWDQDKATIDQEVAKDSLVFGNTDLWL
jgi:hypothetical protein